jgi:hypothetical protein
MLLPDGEHAIVDIRKLRDYSEVGKAVVRSGWIILRDETAPRLTICFVRRKKWQRER